MYLLKSYPILTTNATSSTDYGLLLVVPRTERIVARMVTTISVDRISTDTEYDLMFQYSLIIYNDLNQQQIDLRQHCTAIVR